MAKSRPVRTSPDTSNFFPSIFIIAFLLVGFVPNLEAVDKIAPQWLYLSINNFLCALFLFYNRKSLKEQFSAILSSFMSLSYI